MARVLQIRRGSAAQNDNFTGLVGEITFDTDAKTIRVHDGETLGGFPLARADESSSSGGSFDITSVPAETWRTPARFPGCSSAKLISLWKGKTPTRKN